MTTPSSDSLLPSPPDRSEAEARIQAALSEAMAGKAYFVASSATLERRSQVLAGSVDRIISILDGGQS